MKLRAVLIISTVCVSLLIVGITVMVFSYFDNNPSKPNVDAKMIDVKITSFSLTGYNNRVGVVWNPSFALNYTNFEDSRVDNLTLTFTTNSTYEMEREISIFSPIPPHYYIAGSTMEQPIALESLNGEETKTFYGEVWNSLDDSSKLHGFAIIATLKWQDVILEKSFVYP